MNRNDTESNTVADFIQNGGRIFHRRQGKRTITIAYTRSNGMISYGATIHIKETPNLEWNRREHNLTAVRRYNSSPVMIPDATFNHPVDCENYIREQLLIHGCRSNRT